MNSERPLNLGSASLQSPSRALPLAQVTVQNAKLGLDEELGALKRLDQQARLLEQCASGRPLEELIVEERRLSHSYDGRSVFG